MTTQPTAPCIDCGIEVHVSTTPNWQWLGVDGSILCPAQTGWGHRLDSETARALRAATQEA
jgi:hypothetical protein